MPFRESEALVLRTYAYREADLVVSFLARDRGKLRGIAKGVRRPKNRFGIALERLALSRLQYTEKQHLELVTLERAELAGPANLLKSDYPAGVVLDLIAETADRLLPANDPDDAYFRLLAAVVEAFQRGIEGGETFEPVPPWAELALAYFLLWSARLQGWLPPLDRCIESGKPLADQEPCYFNPRREGLFGAAFKDSDSWLLPPAARAMARRMLSSKLVDVETAFEGQPPGRELQHFLLQRTESQLEKRLTGTKALAALWQDGEAEAALPDP